jgi:hypothetical protein
MIAVSGAGKSYETQKAGKGLMEIFRLRKYLFPPDCRRLRGCLFPVE